jgi:hypothetical protein
MAPSKVSKISGYRRRQQQAAKIVLWGKQMAPCSRCEEQNLVCFVHGLHPRCNECERVNAKCDGTMSEAEWQKLQGKRQETERLIEAEEKRIADASQVISDGVARLSKLKAELKGTVTQQETMVARENANLDFFYPPTEWEGGATSPTFSQVLAELGSGGGSGQEPSCP